MQTQIVVDNELLTKAMKLTGFKSEQDVVEAALKSLLANAAPTVSKNPSRVAGLHTGAIWTSGDFDDPLPEDFWTGNA